jgi:hypothetical protein
MRSIPPGSPVELVTDQGDIPYRIGDPFHELIAEVTAVRIDGTLHPLRHDQIMGTLPRLYYGDAFWLEFTDEPASRYKHCLYSFDPVQRHIHASAAVTPPADTGNQP